GEAPAVDPAERDPARPAPAERPREDVRVAGGDDAERDAGPQAVQDLVDDAVAAEHPDLVADRRARQLRPVAAPLGQERLAGPELALEGPQPLLADPACERVRDQRAPHRQTTKSSRRSSPRAKRSTENAERSSVGGRPAISSATCSPTAGACWKPWPEKPVAYRNRDGSAASPTIALWSGDTS